MQIGICSFSFHRLLADGKQDMFQYITDCKELGCTQLDPWNAHLSPLSAGDKILDAGHNPAGSTFLSAAEDDYLDTVKDAADRAGMPFGLIAVDGAHIYEDDEAKRAANRARAHRWLDVAQKLGAKQVRVDAGGPEDMPAEALSIITAGYRDLVARGKDKGLDICFENHWGPTVRPDNVIRLLESVPGLGFLFDTNNWKPELRAEARRTCAPYATAVHIKTYAWDEKGNETQCDIPTAVGYLLDSGYDGVWGIESCPREVNEMTGARNSVALLRRLVEGRGGRA